MLKKTVNLILLCLIIVFGLCAFDFPRSPENYINDYTGILTINELNYLNSKCRELEQKTGIQIFTGLFKSLDGESIEEAAIKIAEAWKPGQKKKDNGALITVFMNERKMRIDTGYGLEGVLTDVVSPAIIRNDMAPNLKINKFAEGIDIAIIRIANITAPDFTFTSNQTNKSNKTYSNKNRKFSLLEKIIGFIFFIFFIILAIKNPWIFLYILASSGGRSYSSRNGGGGISFGGGGGGSFGGGGASGSW